MIQKLLIEKHLLRRSPLSYILYPLSALYSKILVSRRKLRSRSQYKAPVPIISIGNIVSGGSGKTPITIAVAQILIQRGYQIAVSHRGYKGKYENTPIIIADNTGVFPIAEYAGDEAYLLATRLQNCPVVVGKDRTNAIRLLTDQYPNLDMIIMDDSFQHLKVFHDIDIITFNSEIGLGNGFVIPAGYLREPTSALHSDSILILNSHPGISISNTLAPIMEQFKDRIFHSRLNILGVFDQDNNPVHPLVYLSTVDGSASTPGTKHSRFVAVSGIAFPKSFDDTLAEIGINVLNSFHFPDHEAYRNVSKLEQIDLYCIENGIQFIISTEKDIMKLRTGYSFSVPLLYLKIEQNIDESDRLLDMILSKLSLCSK